MKNDALSNMAKLMNNKKGGTNVTPEEVVASNKASESMFSDAHFEPIMSSTMAERLGIKQISHKITTEDGTIYDISIRTTMNKYGRNEMNGTVAIIKNNGTVVHPFVWDAGEFNQVFLNSYQDNSLTCKKFRAACNERGVDFNLIKSEAVTAITAIIRTTFKEKGLDMSEWLGNKSNSVTSNSDNGFDIMGLFGNNSGTQTSTEKPFMKNTTENNSKKEDNFKQENEITKTINKLEEENHELKGYLDTVLKTNKELLQQVKELTEALSTLSNTTTDKATSKPVKTSNSPAKASNNTTKGSKDQGQGITPFVPSSKQRKGKRLEDIDWDN